MTVDNPDRQQLAKHLRELRATTGLSGNRFAQERLGWPQSRVSRIETGQQLPTEDDLRAWGTAVGVDAEAEAKLLEMLQRAQTEYIAHRAAYRAAGATAAVQGRIAREEARASHLRVYQPGMIPGLLQTPQYMRELFELPCGPRALGQSQQEIEGIIAGRVKRQQILYEPGRRLRFVIGEPALRTPVSSVETLLGQLDRLAAVAGLSTVELGIGPLGEPMAVFPLSGFELLDDKALIETLSGDQQLADPKDVKLYSDAFEQLMNTAVSGPDVVSLIRRVAAELRGGSQG